MQTWQPQSRRCHLPNNQIVNDQHPPMQNRQVAQAANGSLLSRKQERHFHTASSMLAPTSRSGNDKIPNLVRASHPAGGDCTFASQTLPSDFVPAIWSIQRQGAEYRARSAGRQLGAKILELCVRKTCEDRPSNSLFRLSLPTSFTQITTNDQLIFGSEIYRS